MMIHWCIEKVDREGEDDSDEEGGWEERDDNELVDPLVVPDGEDDDGSFRTN